MLEYLIHSLTKKEFERVVKTLRRKKIEFYYRGRNSKEGTFLIYEKSEMVENLLKMWCRKYGTKVYKLKEWG